MNSQAGQVQLPGAGVTEVDRTGFGAIALVGALCQTTVTNRTASQRIEAFSNHKTDNKYEHSDDTIEATEEQQEGEEEER